MNSLRVQNRRRPCAEPPRDAFTLMETLVALALLGMIIGSVSSSLNLYWKYRSSSQQRITSAHVLRGLMEDLVTDLRSAMPVPASTTSNIAPPSNEMLKQLGSSGAQMERTLLVQERLLNLSNNNEKQPIHFVGTPTSLSLLTQHANSRFDNVHTSTTVDQRQHIIWWWNEQGALTIPIAYSGPRQISASLNATDVEKGLVRSDRPFQHDNGNANVMPTTLISNSISSVSFRYLDGSKWRTEWNSIEMLSIPKAVEVTISIRGDHRQQGAELVHSLVIDLPQGG